MHSITSHALGTAPESHTECMPLRASVERFYPSHALSTVPESHKVHLTLVKHKKKPSATRHKALGVSKAQGKAVRHKAQGTRH